MARYLVTLVDDSQCQDREDSSFDLVVTASDAQEAERKALADEKANVYISAITLLDREFDWRGVELAREAIAKAEGMEG